jgi:hypothetical protein
VPHPQPHRAQGMHNPTASGRVADLPRSSGRSGGTGDKRIQELERKGILPKGK